MLKLNTTVFAGAAMALCALLSAASPARADDVTSRSLEVRLQGLDLNAPPDQATLRHRLMVAASKVCSDGGTGLNDNATLDCRKAAFDQAWSQATVLMAAVKARSLLAATAPASAPPATVVASAVSPARALAAR